MADTWWQYQQKCLSYLRRHHLMAHILQWLVPVVPSLIGGVWYFHLHPHGTGMDWQAIGVSVGVAVSSFLVILLLQYLLVLPWRLSVEEGKAHSQHRDALTRTVEVQREEIENVSAELPDFDLEVTEIAFNASRTGGQQIFILAKGFLRRPHKLEAKYSLSVVAHGQAKVLEIVHDIDEWLYMEREWLGKYRPVGALMEAKAMPAVIEAGVTVEGWLHFVSEEVTDTEVGKSNVRLLADTSFGKKKVERKGISIVGTRYLMRRKIYET
jgi:hypothetical protein